MKTVIITHDYYLFLALRMIISELHWVRPDLCNVCPAYDFNDECCLIVDSRIPFSCFEKIRGHLNTYQLGKDCILLEMRRCFLFSRGYRHIKRVRMALSFDEVKKTLMTKISERMFFPSEKMPKLSTYLSHLDKELFRMGLKGFDIQKMSEKYNCSDKRMYFRREQIYKNLGFDSFNKACVFVLQNNMVESKE
jgi:hypothetical protein